MKVMKWVAVAILVAAVAIAIIKSGGAAVGFLKFILGLAGKLLGIKAVEAPAIMQLLGAPQFSLSIGIQAKIIGAAMAVGAIANRFARRKETNPSEREEIIDQTVKRVLDRIAKNAKCLKTINHDGYEQSPADGLATIASPDGTGEIVYNPSLSAPAQTVPNQTFNGVIELGPSFFKKKIIDRKGNDWNKITGLNEHRTREFIILHELRHLYGSNHGSNGLEKDVTEILRDCFGLKPDFGGGIK